MRKTAHYRRVEYVEGQEIEIGEALDLCRDQYPSGENQFPVFGIDDDASCVVAAHRRRRDRQFLHLVIFEAGAGAAVIELLRRINVGETPAPEEREFIQSQIFLLCSHDNVLWVCHNATVRDGRVNGVINDLIDGFSGLDEPPRYLLQAVVNEERVREIMQNGIEEIDLGVNSFRETLEFLNNRGRVPGAGLVSVLGSLMTEEMTDEDLLAAEKVSARISLKPGRSWNNPYVKEFLGEVASEIMDECDEGFAIVTKNGFRVTRESIRAKHSFLVDGNKRVLDVGQVEEGLNQALDNFTAMGMLET